MSINDDWDVEKHKTEHECDEHWELRRKFLLAHKKKFPEDELICLAQVFYNVELLGCRYPKETMDLVAELSKEVAAEYREKQKTKLQRTFVKASEAASSKVKGCTTQKFTVAEKPVNQNRISKKSESKIEMTKTVNNYKRLNIDATESLPKKKTKNTNLPFGDIVLVERSGDVPQSTLACSVNVSGNKLEWKYNKKNKSCDCTIYIDSKRVACASGSSQKIAKKEAAAVALDKLRKYYYTIKKAKSQDNIPDDNIGKKLIKLMGWSGGGLGKSQQGIMEPVTLKQQLSREGLGLKSNSFNMHELKAKCKSAFKEFLMGDMQNDLVFSTDFTSDERATIHQVAREMGLKSRSHGPSNQRKLVISRKIDIRSLVEELKSLGGSTEKYELIEPTS
ncbi:NF-kappa-B-repressing factor [Harpegnathos saltator]|uniref:NF-kappa-B-repressing factor n=1 Tax=Harpegnathos saltator TaxID=610380 RepID=E2BVT2_HARSA|nr:NF-kappa-B-repressing factor [Harpegnathos saltator]